MSAGGTPGVGARGASPITRRAVDDPAPLEQSEAPSQTADEPQSGLSIAVRVVGLMIVLPLAILFLAKMLLL